MASGTVSSPATLVRRWNPNELVSASIAFRSGAVIQYLDVPAAEHGALMRARSKGAYFHAHIRDRYRTLTLER